LKKAFYFRIGDIACRLSYLKINGKFFFDTHMPKVGEWLAEKYQAWMNKGI
jgi:hypothetical protein